VQHHLGLLSTVNLNITEENQMSTSDLMMKKRCQQYMQSIGLQLCETRLRIQMGTRLFSIWCANRGWHQEAQVCRVIVPVRSTVAAQIVPVRSTVAAKTAKICTASTNCNRTVSKVSDFS
jgi:hypothetical protein